MRALVREERCCPGCREEGGGGRYEVVRAEVASQGATLFVVLTDARGSPPPLRIDNYSPVSIMFHQVQQHTLTYLINIPIQFHFIVLQLKVFSI